MARNLSQPGSSIPFSRGLDKIPRRLHGWLALFCLAAALFYVIFGIYVKLSAPGPVYTPFLVTPRQVLLWQKEGRNLLLLELGAGEQAPLLRGALAIGPLAEQPQELRRQAEGFLNSLPAPRPWIICYSVLPGKELVSAFLGHLHELEATSIYALSATPRQWGEAGMLKENAAP